MGELSKVSSRDVKGKYRRTSSDFEDILEVPDTVSEEEDPVLKPTRKNKRRIVTPDPCEGILVEVIRRGEGHDFFTALSKMDADEKVKMWGSSISDKVVDVSPQ